MKRSSFQVASVFLIGLSMTAAVELGGPAARADGPAPASSASASAGAAGQPVPTVASLASFMDANLHFGMSHAQVTDAFNRPGGIFDEDYAPRLSKMQPGSQMQMVEADENNRKAAFAGSYIRFFDDPVGFDSTPIHNEYTYKNSESMQWVRRLGTKQYYFFFGNAPNDRLWKIYSEVPLRAGEPLGATFDEAVAKISTRLGTHGRTRAEGTTAPEVGKLEATTVDWQDGALHLRLIDRSDDHIAGVVVEDRTVIGRLVELRPNAPFDPFAIDPATAAVTSHGVSDPNAARTAPTPSASASSAPHH